MIEAGIFEPRERWHVELVRGQLLQMDEVGPVHDEIRGRLSEWSFEHVGTTKIRIRVGNSIGLPALESAPEPDLAWVVRRDYSSGRPGAEDVLLVIEVAEASLAYDTGEKAELYAAAGVADYWVVDVAARAIEVRRQPIGGRYRSLKTHTGDDEVHPLAAPEVALRPSALWELQ